MRRGMITLAVLLATVVAAAGTGAGQVSAQSVAAPVVIPGGPYAGVAGVPIQFDASASTGVNLTFTWDFGDGTGALPGGSIVTHTFVAPGTYIVMVTATDAFGQTAGATTSATVSPVSSTLAGVFPAASACMLTAAGVACSPTGISPNCQIPGVPVQLCAGLVPAFAPSFVPGVTAPCVLTSAGVVCSPAGISPACLTLGIPAALCPGGLVPVILPGVVPSTIPAGSFPAVISCGLADMVLNPACRMLDRP